MQEVSAAAASPQRSRLKLKTRRNILGYIFILPALLFFLVFVLLPLGMNIYLSFFRANSSFEGMVFIGFKNFADAFSDKVFGKSIVHILIYVLMAVPVNIVLSMGMAMLLNTKMRGSKVFRTLFYLPAVTSAIAASLIWMWLMNTNFGFFNVVLNALGLPSFTWLSHPNTAMFSIMLVTTWTGVGGNMVIFLAALQGLPQEIYEAARIDGAGPVHRFFKLTLPFMAPTMYFILTMTLIGAFQMYDQVFVLTGGQNDTITPVFLIWQNAFLPSSQDMAGYAAAQSVLMFFLIMAVSLVVRIFNRENT